MATTTLYPNGTHATQSNVRDHNDGTTDLHSPINDPVGSENDATYTHTQHSSQDAFAILELDSLPADATTTTPVNSMDWRPSSRPT